MRCKPPPPLLLRLTPLLLAQELQEALRNPFCLGFIGGRENHAIYFVGYRQAQAHGHGRGGDGSTMFLGLDPHTVFPAASPDVQPFPSQELVSQVHVDELDALDAARLDPSLTLAFYFQGRDDFTRFCDDTRATAERKKQAAAAAAVAMGGAGKRGPSALYSVQYAPPANYEDTDVGAGGDSGVLGREGSAPHAGDAAYDDEGGECRDREDDDEYILV